MTNEVKNVPELRFPGFEDEWEEKKLKNIVELLKDGTHGTHKDTINGPWLLSAKNLKNNRINITNYDRKISESDFNKIYKNYTLKKGDILLSIVGTIGRTALVEKPDRIAFQRSVAILRVNNYHFNKYYLYLFETEKFLKKLLRNQVVSAQPGLYLGDLGRFDLAFPSNFKEQQKIGDFFSKLDRQIELEEQKLEKLEQQKKGYMQKIFSQQLRFKDEYGNDYPDWEEKKLNNFLSKPEKLEKSYDIKKDELLTVKLNCNGVEKANVNRALKLGSTNYYKRYSNQFIYGKQNFFNGAFDIIPEKFDSYYTSGDVPALNIDNNIIDNEFFLSYISQEGYYKQKEVYSSGTGSKRIHENTLLDFDILLPSLNEQRRIGSIIKLFDKYIINQSNKIDILKTRKQALLQKMFV
jgi:type I restriction enzyme S subunit